LLHFRQTDAVKGLAEVGVFLKSLSILNHGVIVSSGGKKLVAPRQIVESAAGATSLDQNSDAREDQNAASDLHRGTPLKQKGTGLSASAFILTQRQSLG
jgi:hypothetical protein